MNRSWILVVMSLILLVGGWLGLSGMTLLVALVPMLMLSTRYGSSAKDTWKVFGWSALVFGLWNIATVWWVWYAAAIGVISSTIIEITLLGSLFTLYHRISKKAPEVLSWTFLITGWIACEHIYTVGEISFPWLTLGNGFANNIFCVQWYDTTGVFGGSLWVLLSNILVFRAIQNRTQKRRVAALCIILIPLLISVVKYFTYQETGEPVTVTIVQPNIDPYEEKYELSHDEQTAIMLDLAAEAPRDVEFIIMPETALESTTKGIMENTIESNRTVNTLRSFLADNYPDAQFITGASTWRRFEPGEELPVTVKFDKNSGVPYDYYNTSLAIDAHGPVQIYHKTKLLIGVETVPFHNLLKKWDLTIVDLGGMTGQFGYDQGPKVFRSPGDRYTAGAICWEGVYGEYYNGFATAGAEFMFIISNDGWWDDTPGYKQLFRFSQLRAVETRRAIARSANTGKSGFISQRGDEISSLGWDVRGTLTGEIMTNEKITFYVRYGDYIARICNLLFVLSLLYYLAYRVKKRMN